MIECLLCHRHFLRQLTLWQLLNFQPVEAELLCQTCLSQLEPIPVDQACAGCGRLCTERYCSDCLLWQTPPNFKNRAMFRYNDILKQYMSQYKFYGDFRLRSVFQTQVKREVDRFDADLVIPIPVDAATRQQRGFNQVSGLLEKVDTIDGLATRERAKQQPQSEKNRQQRLQTKQPFVINLANEELNKKSVLIVDDIYTTGRTIRHAATLLINAGASEVRGLTLAHG